MTADATAGRMTLSKSVALAAALVLSASGCAHQQRFPRPESVGSVFITSPEQREAAVDKQVTIIGEQTRTKQPTVCGVDVDGDYELSNREVIVQGVLRRSVIVNVDTSMQTRGPGTFYSVIDPATGRLAKTSANE
jgi:hypothetical protein